jgi:hypothetical protein
LIDFESQIYASGRVSQDMNKSTLHKLLLARRLYELARENTSVANDISLSIGVNLLQDSVELFLLAVSEYLNVGVQVPIPVKPATCSGKPATYSDGRLKVAGFTPE